MLCGAVGVSGVGDRMGSSPTHTHFCHQKGHCGGGQEAWTGTGNGDRDRDGADAASCPATLLCPGGDLWGPPSPTPLPGLCTATEELG